MTDSSYDRFLELCRSRYSCRRFDAKREVPRCLIDKCIEAGRLAPSACNRQPWRFIVIDDPDLLREIRETCRLPGIPHPWWDEVPVFVALGAEREFVTHKLAPAISGLPYWALDLGIAGEHFVLAAAALGLATCWVGWFREKPLKRILGLPKSMKILSLLALGYSRDGPPAKPRPRRTLDEIRRFNREDPREG